MLVLEQGPEQVCLILVCSVCVLVFVQVGFHNLSTGDVEGMVIKAEDSETKGFR